MQLQAPGAPNAAHVKGLLVALLCPKRRLLRLVSVDRPTPVEISFALEDVVSELVELITMLLVRQQGSREARLCRMCCCDPAVDSA